MYMYLDLNPATFQYMDGFGCYRFFLWAQANKSGRNLDLNKIWITHFHYILRHSFCFGFE